MIYYLLFERQQFEGNQLIASKIIRQFIYLIAYSTDIIFLFDFVN